MTLIQLMNADQPSLNPDRTDELINTDFVEIGSLCDCALLSTKAILEMV